jgi:nicotinamidase-related amidase
MSDYINSAIPEFIRDPAKTAVVMIDLEEARSRPELQSFQDIVCRHDPFIEQCRDMGIQIVRVRFVGRSHARLSEIGPLGPIAQPSDMQMVKSTPSLFDRGYVVAEDALCHAFLKYSDNAECHHQHQKPQDALHERGIDTLLLTGFYADVCVRCTAYDGLAEGFNVCVLKGLTRSGGSNEIRTNSAFESMARSNIPVAEADGVLRHMRSMKTA